MSDKIEEVIIELETKPTPDGKFVARVQLKTPDGQVSQRATKKCETENEAVAEGTKLVDLALELMKKNFGDKIKYVRAEGQMQQ